MGCRHGWMAAPRWFVNTSPVSYHPSPGRESLTGLAPGPGTQRVDRHDEEGEGTAGTLGLGLAVHADRPPDGHVRRDRWTGGRVAVQIDVGSAQGPAFLGADPGQQAQQDVGRGLPPRASKPCPWSRPAHRWRRITRLSTTARPGPWQVRGGSDSDTRLFTKIFGTTATAS